MKVKYKLINTKNKTEFQSETHNLILEFKGEHVSGYYIGLNQITKKSFRGRFTTSVHTRLTQTEKKVLCFALLSKIRESGDVKSAENTNYAEVFISYWE